MNLKHISIFILIICTAAANLTDAALPVNQEIRDQISEGEIFFHKGRFEYAAHSWENALKHLDSRQHIGLYLSILVHLAHAYNALGFHEKTLSLFTDAMPAMEKSNNPNQKAIFFSNLADIYLAVGELNTAVNFTEKAVAEARRSHTGEWESVLADVLNNAGNVFVAQGKYKEAAEAYKEAAELTFSRSQTPAWKDLEGFKNLQGLKHPELRAKILINIAYTEKLLGSLQPETVEKAVQHIRSMEDSYAKAENYIALCLLMKDLEGFKNLQGLKHRMLTDAKQIGEKLNNPRIISQCCGYMGQLYEDQKRYDDALRLTRQGIFFAQHGNFPEILYLWQWQLGRLLSAQGNTEPAIRIFKKAVETLNPIRLELFSGFRTRKNVFDEQIKAVYLGLADLYLKQADTIQEQKARENKLKQARDTMETLKALELQNFFKDECVSFTQDETISLDHTPPHTAVIYPIPLKDRLAVLVSLPDAMIHFNSPADFQTLKQTAEQFQIQLQTRSGYGFRENACQLYDWIIRPAESELAANKTDTLIIAPDGALRLIPFSSLHDGEHFLIENYAVATVPAIRLTAAGSSGSEKTDILLSGLSDAVQNFSPLPMVRDELTGIKQIMNARNLFFNADFTVSNLTNEFKSAPYNMLHMATHGVFGGSAKDSFLLTYDSRLDMNHLEELIEFSRFREQKVDLLTLSACQTAMGNERAALGLAGVAVKAGVRSAIATLWFVDDESASVAIREFYRQIRTTPGLSKAKALQNAQKHLIAQRRFRHPVYWAPFLLIGNWM